MRRTSMSSPSPTGWKRSQRSWRRARNSPESSSRMRCLLAQSPWVRPLLLDAALPWSPRGPVDFWELPRLALIWASVAVWRCFLFFMVVCGLCGPTFRLDGRGRAGGVGRVICASSSKDGKFCLGGAVTGDGVDMFEQHFRGQSTHERQRLEHDRIRITKDL